MHAADEVARVARIFSSGSGEVGHRATEARFKAEASGHRYLHLATHGLVDDAMPMVSGLLLEPGDGEDGLLQAHGDSSRLIRLWSATTICEAT